MNKRGGVFYENKTYARSFIVREESIKIIYLKIILFN